MSSKPVTVGFSPGERVPDTGIYVCKHSERHTGSRDTVFESGKKFPLCRVCFWSVRYAFVAYCTPRNTTQGAFGKIEPRTS